MFFPVQARLSGREADAFHLSSFSAGFYADEAIGFLYRKKTDCLGTRDRSNPPKKNRQSGMRTVMKIAST